MGSTPPDLVGFRLHAKRQALSGIILISYSFIRRGSMLPYQLSVPERELQGRGCIPDFCGGGGGAVI